MRGPLLLLALGTLLACGGDPSAFPDSANARTSSGDGTKLVIFAYDRSTSITADQLERAESLTRSRLRSLGPGDRISAMQILQLSLADLPKRWSQTVPIGTGRASPTHADSVLRTRFLRDAADYLATFSDTADRADIDGTDLLATFHDIGEELRVLEAHPGGAVLYLFSDMLQSNRVIDMEGLRRMPAEGWIQEHESGGMLPTLEGLCVVVVGARVDTELGQRVREFWRRYFDATGATFLLRNYTYRPPLLPDAPCR